MTVRVLLVGAGGRMGRFTTELLAGAGDLELVGGLGPGDELAAAIHDLRPDVGIDFTVAGLGADHGAALLEGGVRPVVGTSGVTPEDDARLDALARQRGLAGLVVPNFCVGIALQQELARRVASVLPTVEIIEEHHAGKLDAPSGTAADTARQLAGVKGVAEDAIPIHSVRIEGLYSNQTVVFGGPGEELRIAHRTYGLDACGPGILAALRWVATAEAGVRRGIGAALDA